MGGVTSYFRQPAIAVIALWLRASLAVPRCEQAADVGRKMRPPALFLSDCIDIFSQRLLQLYLLVVFFSGWRVRFVFCALLLHKWCCWLWHVAREEGVECWYVC